MRVPADPGRQRLRLEVKREGSEPSPCLIAARQLDGARCDHQPEQQPEQQPDGRLHRRCRVVQPIAPARRRDEESQETGFEEQRIPLVGQKILADGHQREIGEPGRGGRDHRRDANAQQHRSAEARSANSGDERVARRNPEERRYRVKPREAEALRRRPRAHDVHVLGGGQDAVAAEQPAPLDEQRPERAEVDDAEQPAEYPRGDRKGGQHDAHSACIILSFLVTVLPNLTAPTR